MGYSSHSARSRRWQSRLSRSRPMSSPPPPEQREGRIWGSTTPPSPPRIKRVCRVRRAGCGGFHAACFFRAFRNPTASIADPAGRTVTEVCLGDRPVAFSRMFRSAASQNAGIRAGWLHPAERAWRVHRSCPGLLAWQAASMAASIRQCSSRAGQSASSHVHAFHKAARNPATGGLKRSFSSVRQASRSRLAAAIMT